MRGGLLAGEDLRLALLSGRVFASETIEASGIRGACYDLRLAGDRLIEPDGDRGRSQIRQSGQASDRELILKPGDTAFISTIERAQFDWTIAGTVGAKFRLASRGLLVLHGLAVDPGYGLAMSDGGNWEPMSDQRLHMVVANVGGDVISLKPGTSIAVLQLYEVEPVSPDRMEVVSSPGLERFEEDYFDESDVERAGLVFFRNVRDVSERAERTLAEVQAVRSDAEQLLARVESVETGSKFVVTFGIFLVAVTLLALFLTVSLQDVSKFPNNPSLLYKIVAGVVAAALAVAVFGSVFIGLRHLRPPREKGSS